MMGIQALHINENLIKKYKTAELFKSTIALTLPTIKFECVEIHHMQQHYKPQQVWDS